MPRTIWNRKTYIGDRVWAKDPQQGFRLCPVWDREVNDWIRLNSETNMVDYRLTDLRHDRVTIAWVQDYDFTKVHIRLQHLPDNDRIWILPASPAQHVITGLQPDTEYAVDVLAKLSWGSITHSNFVTFRTPVNPTPAQPPFLRYSGRTNRSITLVWGATTNAAKYVVYQATGTGRLNRVKTVSGTTTTITGLSENTKYRFAVRGENSDGLAGPMSSEVRSQTGVDAIRRRGSVHRLVLPPRAWGSWRPDIRWNWWPSWPVQGPNTAIYQGYWEYQSKRYWGVIEYDSAALRALITQRFGSGVVENLRVTEASLRRVYRERQPGNVLPQELVWRLSSSRVLSSGQPLFFGQHINSHDGPDSLKYQRALGAGSAVDFLRIPRSWGHAVILGKSGANPVTGLTLHRSDSQWNGYGYAGYAKISGHLQRDYHYPRDSWRYSDLSLVVSANWDFQARPYTAPKDW